jgi:DNA adenine methylase
MNYYSPLRYPGGKGKIADYFKQVFKDNLLYDGIYVEPYSGGASVALSLLFNEYASKIVINDIDIAIYAFWHSVLNDTNNFCALIEDTPVNMITWEQQRIVQKEKQNRPLLEVGFSTFFLNRTNRSGIISAGVIGGRQQNGKWKIDARYNKEDLINRIKRIAQYRDRIELYNLDAVELVKRFRKTLPAKALFYFDPPYFVKGPNLYLNYYDAKDHEQISNEISKINKHKWVVTYDNVSAIRKLYKGYRQKKYVLSYSASTAISKGEEVMIFSDNLYIPKNSKLMRKLDSAHSKVLQA